LACTAELAAENELQVAASCGESHANDLLSAEERSGIDHVLNDR
jgi:hypothetical protein